MIVRNSSVALTPSESLRKLVLKSWRGNPEKIKAINWGIDIRSAPTARKENRIVFAGRLFERKGCRYVVEACKNIDLNGWEVAIVGDGPQRQELEKLAGRNAAIKFYGWLSREKLQALYSKSKIFVFPSTAESFGMVIAEAMAAEMAVVTSKDSACPEVVGNAGILVPPKDAAVIKSALEMLMKNPKKIAALGKRARKRVLENFTWERCAKEYEQVYRSRTFQTKSRIRNNFKFKRYRKNNCITLCKL